ncbi:MAG: sigma-70 family RNA polymerase sigma factor [Chloroflexota bacterium]|nr:sigma-70 family RNA polymerase sigma factor [Chloroflexota bacterium]
MMHTHTKRTMPLPSKDESSEAILKRFDWFIGLQTKRVVRHYPALAQQAVVDLEIDELMQRVRIKFWRALERGPILYPRNYIKRIIRSEIIDMGRQRKPSIPLPSDEDEQRRFWEANGLISDEHDPADEVEQQMESSALLERAIPLVLSLPPRQRLAMMCALQEKVDDLMQLVDRFKDYHTDIETLRWPTEQHEKRVLQASLVVARQTIARKMRESQE